MVDVCLENKLSQMTDMPIVNVVDSNNIFSLDSRINTKDKIVLNKNYKTKTKFSCIASTAFGRIAVGSDTGEIRLYQQVGKNAKTLFPSLGGNKKNYLLFRSNSSDWCNK